MKKSIRIIIAVFFGVIITLNSTNNISKCFNTTLGSDLVKNDLFMTNQQTSEQEMLSGTWYWKSTSNDNETEFYLIQNGNEITGKHCSSFMGGTKLDCIENNAEDSITLSLVSENVYEGTIRSGFSEVVINIRLSLNPDNNTLYFKQLSQPSEEYYLPNNVFMTLAQP